MSWSNVYSNSNDQPNAGDCRLYTDSMQRHSIQRNTGRRRTYSGNDRTSRNDLYMGCTGSNRRADRRSSRNEPGIDLRHFNQSNDFHTDSDLYSNANLRSRRFMSWHTVYSDCNPYADPCYL